MDYLSAGVSLLVSLGAGLLSFGAIKAQMDAVAETVTKNTMRLHELANSIQVIQLKQANDVNELRKEAYSTYVTQRQFEAYVASTKEQLTEVRADVKKLLEMVSAGRN